jgi:CubicO group peptidase (beta-lactamase class C family)
LIKNFWIISLLALCGCIPAKSFFLGQPDAKDILRFDSSRIFESDQCFEFQSGNEEIGNKIKVNDWTTNIPFFKGLRELSESHSVRSFLVIKNDSILFQYDRFDINATTIHPSYSIAKSVTSALIGIAIEEGEIKSVNELVSNYIPELGEGEFVANLKIEHLLNHTSGFKYTLRSDADLYYGNDVLKAVKYASFEHPPGTHQHYLNINVQLLGLILHRSTGISPSEYLQEKIWKKIGACQEARWSRDTKGNDRTFCCLGATSLDYAKFGRLFLNKGNWEGRQVVPKDWFEASIERDSTSGSSFNYNYCWHIGLKEYGDFMAIGLYKQHIYINPKKNLIIVVLNDKEKALKAERVNWWNVFRQIVDQV